MAGYLEELLRASLGSPGVPSNTPPLLQIDPNAQQFNAAGPGPIKTVSAFHGTDSKFGEAQVGYGGSRGGVPGEQNTIFFTPNQKLASSYGKNVHQRDIDLTNSGTFDIHVLVHNPLFQQEMKNAVWEQATRNEELRLRANNDPNYRKMVEDRWRKIQDKIDDPKKRANDQGFMRYDSAITSAVISFARKFGIDVAVIKNMAEGHGKPSDQIVVLNQSAILPAKDQK